MNILFEKKLINDQLEPKPVVILVKFSWNVKPSSMLPNANLPFERVTSTAAHLPLHPLPRLAQVQAGAGETARHLRGRRRQLVSEGSAHEGRLLPRG